MQTGLTRLRCKRQTSVLAELWFLRENVFVRACGSHGSHVVPNSANAGLRDYKFAAGEL